MPRFEDIDFRRYTHSVDIALAYAKPVTQRLANVAPSDVDARERQALGKVIAIADRIEAIRWQRARSRRKKGVQRLFGVGSGYRRGVPGLRVSNFPSSLELEAGQYVELTLSLKSDASGRGVVFVASGSALNTAIRRNIAIDWPRQEAIEVLHDTEEVRKVAQQQRAILAFVRRCDSAALDDARWLDIIASG